MKARHLVAAIALCLVAVSCGTRKKLTTLQRDGITAELSISGKEIPEFDMSSSLKAQRDTLKVKDDDGREILIMKAVKDENGEMVATDVIDAAMVTARFRNVAERHGKVDIEFQITVPESMQDSKWQLRFTPDMCILGDTVRLDPVIITGREYRKAQLRGYERYQRFISSIITDSTVFIDSWQLEIFLERNLPELYAFKNDSTFVSEEDFMSYYGVTEQEAIEHYTNKFRRNWNNRKKMMSDRMYHKYVKVPIITEGLRLDTVMQSTNGDFIYHYVQSINTRPKLRKVDILLSGSIFEQEKQIYRIPQSPPLTFYISSLSAFVDNREKYLSSIVSRRVEANTACYIEFQSGRSDIRMDLGHNSSEIARIKSNLRGLLDNVTYDLDSIIVTANCSPEGSYQVNERLSKQRSESVSRFFSSYIKHCKDSIQREAGLFYDMDGKKTESVRSPQISFISKCEPENWKMLDALVAADSTLNEKDKESYFRLASEPSKDKREASMQKERYYKYLRESVYPKLRVVGFDFRLHRKDMTQDTLTTTILDTTYMRGVQAIRDRDYETAVTLLRPYGDFNSAVAFCCMDYNESARSILERLEKTAAVNYMLAVVYARKGEVEKAVEHYMRACAQEESFVHRRNLDPEISALIKTYGLNAQKDDIPVY
ncbi:MAG: hypothetical protein MJY83_03045 [Bacteroidales bacterium]|nr:hypothetical protein [Bacteroidales bacterium]